MKLEVLIPGIRFAQRHDLTQKEMELLVLFLEKPHTSHEVSEILGIHQKTLHRVIQRLKLKNLLILKNRDSKGTNLYEFNLSQLED